MRAHIALQYRKSRASIIYFCPDARTTSRTILRCASLRLFSRKSTPTEEMPDVIRQPRINVERMPRKSSRYVLIKSRFSEFFRTRKTHFPKARNEIFLVPPLNF